MLARLLPDKKPLIILENPNIDEAASRLEEAFNEQRTIILVGNCRVEYYGRASSRLEPGERIVIIKEDGSVLVHRSKGYEPVNWQPPGCVISAYKDCDLLVVKAIKRKPREIIEIFFDRVYLLSMLRLSDEGEFSLYASEEDMRKTILMNPALVEEGFKPINYEKKVEPGFIDIYGIDGDGRMVVIEIKRRTAGKDAALQLSKYIESLRNSVNREIRGILVAPQISREARNFLVSLGLEFKRLDPRRCSEILRRVKTKKIMDFF